jgi:hypothetical protein
VNGEWGIAHGAWSAFKRRDAKSAEKRRGMQRFFLCVSASLRLKKFVENSKIKFATEKYCFIFALLIKCSLTFLN